MRSNQKQSEAIRSNQKQSDAHRSIEALKDMSLADAKVERTPVQLPKRTARAVVRCPSAGHLSRSSGGDLEAIIKRSGGNHQANRRRPEMVTT